MLIFIPIVILPFVIALVALFRADLVERILREPSAAEGPHLHGSVERPGPTP